jgi:GH15 family glucan-1,4-alpha-glucosidase
VLKLLTSKPHGSIVAAPTFGLPEKLEGERNWDYRYTWIRDASFTLYALFRLGYTVEAADFMRWIEGYMKSSPVRIGNEAYNQLQLDIYGELMGSIYLYNKHREPISYDLWKNLIHLTDWVCRNWRRKDEGIWEVRGGQKEFLYSRLMCWVALDGASDGLAGTEGTFNMCSFWYVECLSRAGDVPKARFIFEKLLSYSNHLGLYSEELGPCGEHLGNFPQAFTHLALISAAHNLDLKPSHE